MGGVGKGFTFPVSYPTLIYLSVALSILSGDEKSNLILVCNVFGYPHPISIPAADNFFLIRIKVFFNPGHNVLMHYPQRDDDDIDDYGEEEEREAESVRYEIRKKRTVISECHLKD